MGTAMHGKGDQGMQGKGAQGMEGKGAQGKGKGKGSSSHMGGTQGNNDQSMNQNPQSLIQKLFLDHIWYTNDYIVASMFQLPTAPALKTRLLKNQQDLGKGLGTAFPSVASQSDQITKLLTDHIVAADNVIQAAISKQDLNPKIATLYQQGQAVADSISQAFQLPLPTLRNSFHQHNEHVLKLATLLLNKQNVTGVEYIGELDTYKDQMLMMADMIFQAGHKLNP
jgi:hypothetical protein